jgi:hypothetical protein
MPTKTKPITEFSETCNGPNSCNKWLGISRLSRIPDAGWPSRESCQKAVTAEELAASAKIVAEYRENEQITVDHDADSRQREISRLSPSGHGFDHARLRKELAACCPETFLKAQNRMNELRDEAAKLARPIFERLVDEFDKELNAIALRREEELTQMGIPLYSDGLNSAGYQHREFAIHSDPLVTAWQCRRECVRHSALNVGAETSIAAVQFLCTDEEKTPFQWLV